MAITSHISAGPTGAADTWVTEKGLPHPCQRRIVDDLGDRILIATDLGPVSRRVEARAIELAEEDNASLVVIAVLEPGAETGRLDELVQEARERGIEIDTRVESGDPVDVILRVAPVAGATGVVVGDDQWRGEVPHPCICAPLIRLGPVPVLVLHGSSDHPCELPA